VIQPRSMQTFSCAKERESFKEKVKEVKDRPEITWVEHDYT